MKRRPVPRLRPGDTIGVAALSGATDRTLISRGCAVLTRRGYRVALAENLHARYGGLAGTDRQRAAGFNALLRRPEITGIVFARGGYGAIRTLAALDWTRLARRPRVLIGYSDLTVLFAAVRQRTGLPCFYGPMVTDLGRSANPFTRRHWFAAVSDPAYRLQIPLDRSQVFHPGRAEGVLAGGCLSLLSRTLDTPWEQDLRRTILFLEDVNETPQTIDAMLQHLRQSGRLRGVRGVILGRWKGCRPPRGHASLDWPQVYRDGLGDLGVPIITDFPCSHHARTLTLPLGCRVRIDTRRRRVEALESPLARE